jgi:hypothetical protein
MNNIIPAKVIVLSEIQKSSILCYLIGWYSKETPDNQAVFNKGLESALEKIEGGSL